MQDNEAVKKRGGGFNIYGYKVFTNEYDKKKWRDEYEYYTR